MSKILKISIMTLAAIFLIGCGGGDPEVDALVDAMVSESEGAISEKDAKCFVNGIKDEASDKQWDMFVAMTLDGAEADMDDLDSMMEDLDSAVALASVTMSAALKCGVDMEL
tara:strand:- start:1473 stop:1808 length:336 start_codon:yes stop_codon:yes gene_type:complete